MRRVLAWLRHGRRLHADVTSGRYALRRKNEALTAALAECRAERDALAVLLDEFDRFASAGVGSFAYLRSPFASRVFKALASTRPAQPEEDEADG